MTQHGPSVPTVHITDAAPHSPIRDRQDNQPVARRGGMWSRLLCEPLVHFLAIGAALFAASAWTNRDGNNGDRSNTRMVRITEAEVAWLRETWTRQWQRPPTEQELRGLVTDYLKETLLAREATDMGLTENDTVIRRRLAQKIEFLVRDTVQMAEPTEDELRRHHASRRDQFAEPARVTFTQTPDQGGVLLPTDMTDADLMSVAGVFGHDFARDLFNRELGRCALLSTYGRHQVNVLAKQPARPREFADVRTLVLQDWQQEEQRKAHQMFITDLLKKYDVVAEESVKPLLVMLETSP